MCLLGCSAPLSIPPWPQHPLSLALLLPPIPYPPKDGHSLTIPAWCHGPFLFTKHKTHTQLYLLEVMHCSFKVQIYAHSATRPPPFHSSRATGRRTKRGREVLPWLELVPVVPRTLARAGVSYMWNLKYDTNEPIYETETNSQT